MDKIKRKHKINIQNVINSSNIFSFLFKIYKTFKNKNMIYLIISITPYTFFSYIFLFLFRKKTFIYLRSNGYEEYKQIFGFWGPIIYHLMFLTVTFKSEHIIESCLSKIDENFKVTIVENSDNLEFKKKMEKRKNAQCILANKNLGFEFVKLDSTNDNRISRHRQKKF